MISRYALYFVLLSLAGLTMATEESLRPGGIAIVKVGSTGPPQPTALFDDKPVMVIRRDEHWYAVVGIPLSVSPWRNNDRCGWHREDDFDWQPHLSRAAANDREQGSGQPRPGTVGSNFR